MQSNDESMKASELRKSHPSTGIKRPAFNIKPKSKHITKYQFSTLSRYIYKVLKTLQNDLTISRKSMDVMNSLLFDLMERIALESMKLVKFTKKCTLGAREVQTSVSLIFPGELSKHALSEGSKATTKFLSSRQ